MPKGNRSRKEMALLKEKALSLISINPTMSMAAIARHFGVCEETVRNWFFQAGLKRWYA
jgi:transposase-like protein